MPTTLVTPAKFGPDQDGRGAGYGYRELSAGSPKMTEDGSG